MATFRYEHETIEHKQARLAKDGERKTTLRRKPETADERGQTCKKLREKESFTTGI